MNLYDNSLSMFKALKPNTSAFNESNFEVPMTYNSTTSPSFKSITSDQATCQSSFFFSSIKDYILKATGAADIDYSSS
jgi:hypothetical protein